MANIDVVNGDLGAVYSVGGDFIVSSGGAGINAIAENGDLRAFDAISLGTVELGTPGTDGTETLTRASGANLLAYRGSVGMIRASGTSRSSNIGIINEDAQLQQLPAIGGDIQYIAAPNTLITDLACNGSIGVVQARSSATSSTAAVFP